MKFKCPGQDSRNLKVSIIKCPECRYEVEIFSDEVTVKCPKCMTEVSRERLLSCIDWCEYAKDCIGEEKWKRYLVKLRKVVR